MQNNLTYRFLEIVSGAWRRRYVIAMPILIMPVLGLFISILTPDKYHAHTSLLIQETAKLNPFLEDLAVSSNLKERMEGLKTLLHSRHILAAVAKETGLVTAEVSERELQETIDILSSSLKVTNTGKDLIRIDYKSHTAANMGSILESVSQHFTNQLLAPERSSITDSAYFLAQHLKAKQDDLNKAELALAEYKDSHSSQLPELHAANLTRLASLKQNLAEKEAELAGSEKKLGGLTQQLSSTDPVVGRIEEQIITIRSDMALLRARYTDSHSKVQAELRKLRRLQEERQRVLEQDKQVVDTDKLWDMASTMQSFDQEGKTQPLLISQLEQLQLSRSKVDSLEEETSRLRDLIDELEAQAAGYGEQERKLTELQRDLSVKRKLYEDLLHRYEMAKVTGSLGKFEESDRVKVIDRPFTPISPSNPSFILYMLGGIFGGLAIGIGMATLLEFTDTSIRRRDQLEAITGIPVISRIPPFNLEYMPSIPEK
jgi:polysaccharide chain length determinant protein (PEP-CTERM system associated)